MGAGLKEKTAGSTCIYVCRQYYFRRQRAKQLCLQRWLWLLAIHGHTDFPRGNLVTGISGRLCTEIIGHFVDDRHFSNGLLWMKVLCIENHQGAAAVAEKDGKVTGMHGVFAAFRIVMGIPLMQMKTEEASAAFAFGKRKSGYHCGNQRSLPDGIKENFALDRRIFFAAGYFCTGFRLIKKQYADSFLQDLFH